MRVSSTVLLVASFVCCASNRGTTGSHGNIEFRYTACRADFETGCSQQNEPLAAGGAQITIAPRSTRGCGGPAVFASADSTDPTVFMAAVVEGLVVVTTANAGEADLRLLDDHGGEIDRITLFVERAQKIAVAIPGASGITIMNGFTQTVHFDRFDQKGAVLIGYGGIDFDTPNPVVIDQPRPEPADGYFHGSSLAFHGSDGSAQIVASSGNASLSFAASFVDSSKITTAVIGPQRPHVVENGHSLTEIDSAGAIADGTLVFGALCQWTNFAGTLAAYSDSNLDMLSSRYVEDTPLHAAYFEGAGTATCTVGAASQTLSIP